MLMSYYSYHVQRQIVRLRNLKLWALHILSHTLLSFVFIIMSIFLTEGRRLYKPQAPPNLDPPVII